MGRCPTEAAIALTPTKFTFELEGEPANTGDLKLIIQASAAPVTVFMKYFFVNTVTGEKSGEMLAVATLKEDETPGE